MASGLFDLGGRGALVTGASSGIGRAIAEELGRAGARVVVSSNEAEACDAVTDELRREGIGAYALPCDVADGAAVRRLVADAAAELGGLDFLVSCAGTTGPSGPLASASDADFDRVMDVNLRASVWLTSAGIPHLVERGGGSVILIASIAGVRGNRSIGLYGLSKAALAQLARNLAVEWGPRNVRVNAISPGFVATRFSAPLTQDPAFMQRRMALTPLRRAGTAREIAGAAVFLASDAGAFVTGQNLIVDGGTTITDGT